MHETNWKFFGRAALCAAFGLVACGDDDDTATDGDATTTTAAADEEGATDTVEVVMSEYSYQVSGELNAGGTINLSNAGKEFHMMGIVKLKDGKTIQDLAEALSAGGDEGEEEEEGDATTTTAAAAPGGDTTTTAAGEEGGEEEDPAAEVIEAEVGAPGAIVGPGQGGAVTVPDFGAGNYALVCFIPTEGPEGQPHFSKGMINELTVVDGEAVAAPEADVTYNVTAGQNVEGPAELSAGHHVLKIVSNSGDVEPTLIRPDNGKTYEDLDKVFDTFDEALPLNAADQVPGDLVFGMFDLDKSTTVYLAVDLEPGTYELVVSDTDVDNPPALPPERIVITVT